MRYFRSQGAHKRYAPYQSGWRRFLSNRKKQKRLNVATETNSWHNPYRSTVVENKTGKRSLLIVIAAIIVILGWIGTMIFLPYFRVTNIAYSGLKIIKQNEIDKDVRDNLITPGNFWPKNNYFILNTKKIAKYLQEHYSLSSASITKIFPNNLKIDVEEKISTVIYDNGKDYYLLDQNGAIIKYLTAVGEDEIITPSAPNTSTPTIIASSSMTMVPGATSSIGNVVHIPNYKKINDEFGPFPIIYSVALQSNTTSTPPNNQLLTPGLIGGVINFYTQIAVQGIAQIKYLTLDNPLAGILAKTNKRWDVYFQPTDNIGGQLKNLKAILKNSNPTSYIDLRYGERIYWK